MGSRQRSVGTRKERFSRSAGRRVYTALATPKLQDWDDKVLSRSSTSNLTKRNPRMNYHSSEAGAPTSLSTYHLKARFATSRKKLRPALAATTESCVAPQILPGLERRPPAPPREYNDLSQYSGRTLALPPSPMSHVVQTAHSPGHEAGWHGEAEERAPLHEAVEGPAGPGALQDAGRLHPQVRHQKTKGEEAAHRAANSWSAVVFRSHFQFLRSRPVFLLL
jgi:hypothetical protein